MKVGHQTYQLSEEDFVSESIKEAKTVIDWCQSHANYFYGKYEAMLHAVYLESLILAQDERWRRA